MILKKKKLLHKWQISTEDVWYLSRNCMGTGGIKLAKWTWARVGLSSACFDVLGWLCRAMIPSELRGYTALISCCLLFPSSVFRYGALSEEWKEQRSVLDTDLQCLWFIFEKREDHSHSELLQHQEVEVFYSSARYITSRKRKTWGGGWEGGSKRKGYMYTYGWLMLRFDRKQQNSGKQLSFNLKIN